MEYDHVSGCSIRGGYVYHFDWALLNLGENITSFGEDTQGELYVMTSQDGLYRIAPN